MALFSTKDSNFSANAIYSLMLSPWRLKGENQGYKETLGDLKVRAASGINCCSEVMSRGVTVAKSDLRVLLRRESEAQFSVS